MKEQGAKWRAKVRQVRLHGSKDSYCWKLLYIFW